MLSKTFEKAMIREFGAPAAFGSLFGLLNSFKQEQNKPVRDFYHPLMLGYSKFILSLSDTFARKPWEDENDGQILRGGETSKVVTDFHLRDFFFASRKSENRKEVIKAGPNNIEEILVMAKRLEQAKLQE